MTRAEHPTLSKLPWIANLPTTDKECLHLKACSKAVIICVFTCKLKDLANSRGSYHLADVVTLDNTLDQVHHLFR